MKNTQKLFVFLLLLLLVIIGAYYLIPKNSSDIYVTNPTPVINNNQTEVSGNNSSVSVPASSQPSITKGFANTPIIMANRLVQFGYPAESTYRDFADLISDIKTKNNSTVRIVGDAMVGGIKGYEISLDGQAGAWVIKDSVLYTYYFDKSSPLSESDKVILSSQRVGM